jgi:molybdopterin converting factor small subunit
MGAVGVDRQRLHAVKLNEKDEVALFPPVEGR